MTELQQKFENLTSNLTPREKDVLRLLLGIDDNRMRTLEEIAVLFGISSEETEAIINGAMNKIDNPKEIDAIIAEVQANWDSAHTLNDEQNKALNDAFFNM